MKRAVSLCALLLISLAGCRDNSPELAKTLDFRTFRLTVPETWKSIPTAGYDSQVGRLTNGQDELRFDYGWYSYDLRNETATTHTRTATTIGGYPALIVRPLKKGRGLLGLYVETSSMNRLVLTGQDIQDEQTVLKIFESVTF